jgi:hypothetical protein
MQITYTLEHRDLLEVASARFPGDRPRARAPRSLGAMAALLTLALGLYVLTSHLPAVSRAASPPVVMDPVTEAPADPLDNPVFGMGVLVTALGAIFYVVPLAYFLGMRRSARPVHAAPVTVGLDEAGLTVRSKAKEFALAWDGVVAVCETPRLFVLKTVGDVKLALPKRALEEPADVDALGSALRQYVPAMAEAAAS